MTRILLTGVGGSAASNVFDALSLSPQNYEFFGSDASPYMLALSSLPNKFLVPRASHPDYLPALRRMISNLQIDALIAQPDPEVMLISKHRHDLPVGTFLPDHQSIELAADKALAAEAFRNNGTPVPLSIAVTSIEQLVDSCHKLLDTHDKLWIRATKGAGSRAALPISSSDQAINWVRWWIEERNLSVSDFMVSEFLSGREFAVQTVWQDGQLVVAQARERLEYLYGFLAPSGQSSTPSVAKTVSDPVIYDIALSAIRALSPLPNGIFCVDMKCNSMGTPCVTEINTGRFFTTSNFFAHAGVNMPEMAIRAALGERLPALGVNPLRDDLYWIRMVDMGFRLVTEDQLEQLLRA